MKGRFDAASASTQQSGKRSGLLERANAAGEVFAIAPPCFQAASASARQPGKRSGLLDRANAAGEAFATALPSARLFSSSVRQQATAGRRNGLFAARTLLERLSQRGRLLAMMVLPGSISPARDSRAQKRPFRRANAAGETFAAAPPSARTLQAILFGTQQPAMRKQPASAVQAPPGRFLRNMRPAEQLKNPAGGRARSRKDRFTGRRKRFTI